MIALTQKDVLSHEVVVPWSEPYQVEQDLLLCLAMRAIFEDRFLSGQVPFPVQFRGANLGTEIVSYNINEMLATKMRALFQRRKGRDRSRKNHPLICRAVSLK